MPEKEEEVFFHMHRIAFLILNNEIVFLQNSPMSHREWFNKLNSDLDFDNVIRGFIYNNKIVVYKGDFTFDDHTIEIARKYYPIIVQKFELNNPELWCGQKKTSSVRPISDPWPPIKKII